MEPSLIQRLGENGSKPQVVFSVTVGPSDIVELCFRFVGWFGLFERGQEAGSVIRGRSRRGLVTERSRGRATSPGLGTPLRGT